VSRTYLVECYWPGVDAGAVEAALARADAEEDVQCVDTILVPEDEIVLCLFKGPSAQAVRAATLRSGLPSERVTPSIRLHTPPERGEP
jgi:Nickel responsive protein SCO4226-like